MSKKLNPVLAAAGLVLATVASSSALTVNWNVDSASVSPISPSADSVSASANSGSVNLTVGVPSTIVGFDAFTYADGATLSLLTEDIPFDLSRDLTLNGVTQLLNQNGDDNVTPGPDTFTVDIGSTTSAYNLGGGYTVDVTVDGDSFFASGVGAGATDPVNATFTLEGPAAPDAGSTAILLGVGIAGLGALRRKLS
jgi:hypothetical protein